MSKQISTPNAHAKHLLFPNPWLRSGVHVCFWGCAFFFNIFITYRSLRAPFFSPFTLVYCTFPWLGSVAIHYLFCAFTLPYVYQRRWLWVLPGLVCYHGIALLCSAYFCTVVSLHFFPDNAVAADLYDKFWAHPNPPVHSINGILRGSVIVIWINVPAILIKMAIDYFENTRQQAAIQAEKQAMEISFLRAQIQPHFLFNSLNSIYGLVLENEAASNSVLQLSDLLRFSLYDSAREYVTLREELHFLENYLLLEKQRHKAGAVHIRYDFNAVENPEQMIRPLLLINFIEHAFRYGINARIQGAWVEMALSEKHGRLHFSVRNNYAPGTDPQQKNTLQNVQRRLELEYPERYRLDIAKTPAEHRVQLDLQL